MKDLILAKKNQIYNKHTFYFKWLQDGKAIFPEP